jgi:LysR family transcriptional regulator (chromosome initiation inhibitor)
VSGHAGLCRPLFCRWFTHAALAQAPAIIFSGKDDLHSQFLRQVASYDGSTPHLTLPTPQGFVQATRLGLAYSLLPELMIDDDLESGRLRICCPGSMSTCRCTGITGGWSPHWPQT